MKITSKNHLFNIARYDDGAILITKEGCSYCKTTLTELREIIKKDNILIYTIDINYYLEAYNNPSNQEGQFVNYFSKISATFTLLFFKGGKLLIIILVHIKKKL